MVKLKICDYFIIAKVRFWEKNWLYLLLLNVFKGNGYKNHFLVLKKRSEHFYKKSSSFKVIKSKV